MERGNQKYDLAYSPLPSGFIKEELQEPNVEGDQDEDCTEHQGQLKAYAPLPHSAIKVEFQSGDEHAELNSEIEEDLVAYSLIPGDVVKVKEEPTSEEDDDYGGCELVAYAPLPHGVVKTEPESGDSLNEFQTEIRMPSQGGKETRLNQNETFVDSTAADNDENDTEPPRAVKRKRSAKKTTKTAISSGSLKVHQSPEMRTSSRILRSHSKGISTAGKIVDDGGARGKRKEEGTTSKNYPAAKQKQQSSDKESMDEMSEHSSLEDVEQSYEDSSDEDLISNHSAAGPSQSKKKAIGKPLNKDSHHEEKKDKPFVCKNCGSSFKLEQYLKKHLARTCGVDLPCNYCGHQFKRKDKLQKHLMTIHDVDKSQLALFGAGPKIRPTFASKCDRCGNTYKDDKCLARHMKYQCQKDPSFPCTLCDYRGTRKSSLRSHLMRVHDVDRSQFSGFAAAAPNVRPEQPFKCNKCGRSYKQKGGLNQHLKFECGVDPLFPCPQCDYRAWHKSYLRSHLLSVHNVERSQLVNYGAAAPAVRPEQPFGCEKCERTYKHKKHLNRHKKYECGKVPSFKCNQCDYRASQKCTLKKHIFCIHAGAGPSQPEA